MINLTIGNPRVADTYHAWPATPRVTPMSLEVARPPRSMRSAPTTNVLTPGRYVGVAAQEEDSEPFDVKIDRLVTQLEKKLEQVEALSNEVQSVIVSLKPR